MVREFCVGDFLRGESLKLPILKMVQIAQIQSTPGDGFLHRANSAESGRREAEGKPAADCAVVGHTEIPFSGVRICQLNIRSGSVDDFKPAIQPPYLHGHKGETDLTILDRLFVLGNSLWGSAGCAHNISLIEVERGMPKIPQVRWHVTYRTWYRAHRMSMVPSYNWRKLQDGSCYAQYEAGY